MCINCISGVNENDHATMLKGYRWQYWNIYAVIRRQMFTKALSLAKCLYTDVKYYIKYVDEKLRPQYESLVDDVKELLTCIHNYIEENPIPKTEESIVEVKESKKNPPKSSKSKKTPKYGPLTALDELDFIPVEPRKRRNLQKRKNKRRRELGI